MSLTKKEKSKFRGTIFNHLDGIGVAPTATVLQKRGVLDFLLEKERAELPEITATFKANEGYLNVALRILCSQGWLTQAISEDEKTVVFSLTDKGRMAIPHVHLYREAVDFIPFAIKMEDFIHNGFDDGSFYCLSNLFQKHCNNWGLAFSENEDEKVVQDQMLRHIEGLIVGPLIVSLGIQGLFHKYFSIAPFEAEEFTEHHEQLKAIVDFFTHLGWFVKKGSVYNFTSSGLFFARRASAYGVTVSYMPMFMRLEEIMFGNPNIFWERPAHSPEIHVNRAMNVWGSGGAHSSYFKKVDEIIVDIFNKPIHRQPRGIADIGCGNGALLEHVFEVIWSKTERGKMLDEYPLFIVGADFNDAALVATRHTLNTAGIWAKVIWGDIGNPDFLAKEMKEKYEIDLGDLLCVRSFLDHNRIYSEPKKTPPPGSTSTGAFCFRGKRLLNSHVEQNLVEHLENWAPYVRRFGLLVIELHSIDPHLAAANIGKTAVTAYDATHGYSDQYILELDNFLQAAEKAGLLPVPA
ncbi:MAG: class I SAM-dependent methyltransferase, partial [Saprospiraceae bacterium]